jgi:hypothetical protein
LGPEPGITNAKKIVGFEVFTAVVMKSTIFWDITPVVRCQPMFRRNISPPSSGLKYVQKKKTACHLLARWFLAELISSTLKMGAMFLRNVG